MKLELLKTYLQANVAPILLEGVDIKVFENIATILPSNIDITLLNGHYEGIDFVPPTWYNQIKEKENEPQNLLVIEDITKISCSSQMKFYELLKYRKIGVFDLPKNCVIIVLCSKLDKSLIHETIYSLTAHIYGEENANNRY